MRATFFLLPQLWCPHLPQPFADPRPRLSRRMALGRPLPSLPHFSGGHPAVTCPPALRKALGRADSGCRLESVAVGDWRALGAWGSFALDGVRETLPLGPRALPGSDVPCRSYGGNPGGIFLQGFSWFPRDGCRVGPSYLVSLPSPHSFCFSAAASGRKGYWNQA